MRILFLLIHAVLAVTLAIPGESCSADHEDISILGVFGIVPVPEGAAFAIWVPLDDGSSISGVRWFHNDEDIAFPRISAMAGDQDRPGPLDSATIVAVNVSGPSYGWSECVFSQPLASQGDGIYVVFELPVNGEITAEGRGGGAGIGYVTDDRGNLGWITDGGDEWSALAVNCQMAILPIASTEKSASPHVLVPGQRSDLVVYDQGDIQATADLKHDYLLLATPNPFNPETVVRFELSSDTAVSLTVYDLMGRRIRGLMDTGLTAGLHSVPWNGRNDSGANVASGIYLVRLIAGNDEHSLRVTLSK